MQGAKWTEALLHCRGMIFVRFWLHFFILTWCFLTYQFITNVLTTTFSHLIFHFLSFYHWNVKTNGNHQNVKTNGIFNVIYMKSLFYPCVIYPYLGKKNYEKRKKNLLHFLFPPNVNTAPSKHGRDRTATTNINPSNLNKPQKNEIKTKI